MQSAGARVEQPQQQLHLNVFFGIHLNCPSSKVWSHLHQYAYPQHMNILKHFLHTTWMWRKSEWHSTMGSTMSTRHYFIAHHPPRLVPKSGSTWPAV